MHHKLTDDEIARLSAWFQSMLMAEKPEDVTPVPALYRPTFAYSLMVEQSIIDPSVQGALQPWTLGPDIADYYCDVWYANRIAAMRAVRAHQEAHSVVGVGVDADFSHRRAQRRQRHDEPGRA